MVIHSTCVETHSIFRFPRPRVNYVKDEKLKDTGTFTLLKEDHTMGNMLRYSLLRDPRVLFAGYRMPHPLEYRTLVRVRSLYLHDFVTMVFL